MRLFFYPFFEVLMLTLLLGLVYWIYRLIIVARNRQEEENLDERPTSLSEVEMALKKYGKHANSIYHLYGKINHLKPELARSFSDVPPIIAQVSLPDCNIMIMDPLCDLRDTKEILQIFARSSVEKEKKCLLFPVSEYTAKVAKDLGFGLLQVGREPAFDLRTYSEKIHSSKILGSIRHIFKQGWTIDMVQGDQIDNYSWKSHLLKITDEWLNMRQSESLDFISEVRPFDCKKEKIYFIARMNDHVEAFLACSPIFGRKGFYFHDLIRRPSGANGLSEALTVTALRNLKELGYEYASLGIVPLAGLDAPGVNLDHPWINKILTFAFKKYKSFVKFKDLYHFKRKFSPSVEDPVFVAYYPDKFTLRYVTAVAGLFSPKGLYGELLHKVKQWSEGNLLPRPLHNLLSSDIATLARPVPFTFYEFTARMKFTLSLFFLNIYTYLNTSSFGGRLTLDQISAYGFSFESFLNHKWFVLVTSNFLHFNFLHLMGNMTMLLIFCGTLEFIGGAPLAMLIFLISMNADIPTGFFLLPLLKVINLDLWHTTMTYLDVGASLGIVGTLGGLLQFLKHKRTFLFIMIVFTTCLAIYQKLFFGLDHTIALIMGYILAHFYLSRKNQKYFYLNSTILTNFPRPTPKANSP